jgi:trigger factor
MNVTFNKIDPVNATITIDVVKEDYSNTVEKNIKDLRKSAVIPGFRKGMASLSRIQQMYGKSVLIEELNRLVKEKLADYVKEEKLNIMGEPLLRTEKHKNLDFEQENYSFTFDVGLTPQIDIKLSKEDKVPYYSIEITDNMIDKRIDNFRVTFGSSGNGEEVEERDLVKGVLTEADENGNPKADGIRNESAVLMPEYIKDEEEKAKCIGAKLNSTIVFNPHKAYEGNVVELASFLNIKKDEIENYTGNFSLEIKEITRYKEAEINQELFDKVFEPGTVTTEEIFREKVKEDIARQLTSESNYRFQRDAYKYLEEKVGELKFPETFLKRRMLASSTDMTPESLDADFPKIIKEMKLQMIKEQLITDYQIEIENADIIAAALQATYEHLSRLGVTPVSNQLVESYAQDMLKKENAVHLFMKGAVEMKLADLFKKQLTTDIQTVTIEEFRKLP